MHSPGVTPPTSKREDEEEDKNDNHVYEQTFKPFWITSACLNLLYRSVRRASATHLIYFNTTICSHWTESQWDRLKWCLKATSPPPPPSDWHVHCQNTVVSSNVLLCPLKALPGSMAEMRPFAHNERFILHQRHRRPPDCVRRSDGKQA